LKPFSTIGSGAAGGERSKEKGSRIKADAIRGSSSLEKSIKAER
jgi:hypothetical protein